MNTYDSQFTFDKTRASMVSFVEIALSIEMELLEYVNPKISTTLSREEMMKGRGVDPLNVRPVTVSDCIIIFVDINVIVDASRDMSEKIVSLICNSDENALIKPPWFEIFVPFNTLMLPSITWKHEFVWITSKRF